MDSVRDLNDIFAKYPRRIVKKKQIVLSAGELNNSLYLLESGYISTHLLNYDGWEFTINILAPGSVFPLTQVLSDMNTNPHEFKAMTTSAIRIAPTDIVLKYLDENPTYYTYFARKFAVGIEGLVKRIEYLVRADGVQRVICAFDLMVKKFGINNTDGSVTIGFAHTHQDIADIAGVSRETTSRVLQKLKKMGVIVNRKRMTQITNPLELNKLLKTEDSDWVGDGL